MKKNSVYSYLFPLVVFFFSGNPTLSAQSSVTSKTFIISNEAPGYLIDNLIANGYRDSSMYAVLVALKPSSGGIISDAFINKVSACPAKSDVFTARLWNFSDPSNNPVGIGEDGNLVVAPVYGRDLSGKEGFITYNDTLVPVSLKLFTNAIRPEFYIDAAVRTADGIKTFYKAFAIAWSMGSTLVLSNEAPGSLIDKLIAAGHGNKNLYQVLQFLSAQPGSSIPKDFVTRVGSTPNGSDVKSVPLTTFANIANNPVCINADGSAHIASIYGKNYYKNAGYLTNTKNYPGITLVNFTHATSKNFYINAGTGSGIQPYQAFGIVWATEAPTTFVLTNEGGLIDDLIRAGHGTKNLYQTLEVLKPKSGGVITDEFMASLAKCPTGSDIFTAALTNFGINANNPICINTDGTLTINGIFGKDYLYKNGYTTLPLNQGGYTPELFTFANSTDKYIDAGSSGISGGTKINYKAFAIAWKASTTFVLTNEGRLIDDLIRAGHGTKNLYQTLELLKPKSEGVISDGFMATLAKCPAGSDIFTAALSNFGGLNNPVCVNTNGALTINPIFGKDYLSRDGYSTLPLNQGVNASERFTVANSADKFIDAGIFGQSRYKAFAIAWSQCTTVTTTVSKEICRGESLAWQGGVYSNTGTYTKTLKTQKGCDSVLVLNLSVFTVNTGLTSDGLILSADAQGAKYQWVDCNSNNAPLAGQQNRSFTATANGKYAVTVTQGTCSETSRCISITKVGNDAVQSGTIVSIFPNPATGKVSVWYYGNSELKSGFTVGLFDPGGRLIRISVEGNPGKGILTFNVSHLPEGVYFCRIIADNQKFIKKIVIVKR